MCGIAAILVKQGPSSRSELEHDIAAATRAMRHRGPDGHGLWLSPSGRTALGHRRLSLVDLATGAQPISNEDGRIHIVVNGEFYDYRRIRRELEARGHRFRTGSDSEIALHLYEERGFECLEELRGEFAFAIWDENSQRLFAARDRFGIKPLFYAEAADRLYLASEAKALFAAGVESVWDPEAVFGSMVLALDPRRSMFGGVGQLPAGHFMVATETSIRHHRYWDADYPLSQRRPALRPDEYVVAVGEMLDEVVRLRLDADVPVACLLSGGLDSSAALGVAAQHHDTGLAAFTVGFTHPDYDESPRAEATARHVGAEYHHVSVTDAAAADCLADAVWSGEMVQYNAHAAARYLLSFQVQQAGYKAVLAGEGADELFAGYHFCRAAVDAAVGRRVPTWARVILDRLRPMSPSRRAIARVSPWLARAAGVLRLPEGLIRGLGEKLELLDGVIDNDFAETISGDPYKELLDALNAREQISGREPVQQILYLWMKTVFVNYVLAGERMDMAHSVEVRLPFLDHKLFELTRGIPTEIQARGGQQKWLLREAARPVVTDEVYRGVKHGFLAPPSTLMPGSRLHQLIQDTLRSQSMARLPFFDEAAVKKLLDRMAARSPEANASLDPLLMMMTSLCILQDRYAL